MWQVLVSLGFFRKNSCLVFLKMSSHISNYGFNCLVVSVFSTDKSMCGEVPLRLFSQLFLSKTIDCIGATQSTIKTRVPEKSCIKLLARFILTCILHFEKIFTCGCFQCCFPRRLMVGIQSSIA